MINHDKILEIAQGHLATIEGTLRCWAVELHGGKQTLMSYWRGAAPRVEAKAVFIDRDGGSDLELVAALLNERNGSGPELLRVLRSLHQGDVAQAEQRITPATLHQKAPRSIN